MTFALCVWLLAVAFFAGQGDSYVSPRDRRDRWDDGEDLDDVRY